MKEKQREIGIYLEERHINNLRLNALKCIIILCKGGAENERENQWIDKSTFGQAKNNKGRG